MVLVGCDLQLGDVGGIFDVHAVRTKYSYVDTTLVIKAYICPTNIQTLV